MHGILEQKRSELAMLCRRFTVKRLDAFGSAVQVEEFEPDRSDIDLLVEFAEPDPDLLRFLDFREALQELLAYPVDLVDRKEIEASRNYIRRRRILGGAEAVYAG